MEIPFIGGAYLGRSSNLDSQRCVNLVPEVDKQGGRTIFLAGTPGLAPYTSITTANGSDYTGTYSIGVNADSGGWRQDGSNFSAGTNSYTMGNRYGTLGHVFFRIPTFVWLHGFVMDSFKIFVKETSGSTAQNAKAYFVTGSDPDAPTSYAEVAALSLDSGSATFTMGGVTSAVFPEMNTQATAILNGTGFTSGDSLLICVKALTGGNYYWSVNPLLSTIIVTISGIGAT